LAQERGLDLKTLSGSGPDGAVLAADILSLRSERIASAVEAPMAETITVTRTWRVMVDRLSQAWTTIPHFYLMREVNASRLVAWREKLQVNSAEKITYTDLLVKLTAAALQKFPRLNASWQKENIVLHPEINIGLAVAVEDGLLVPVIQHADRLSLTQLAARRSELVARAQAGRLALDDLSGGTFTISNLGMYGVDAFHAIVNPPQAAILAVSRIAERVVPVHGQPAVQPMVTLSLSCDHRVVDGARGAQFLQALADLIEEPLQLLN
jgi:pyruvate dehydrogenase E2 component (dihydrolipoamide acetyltransferase)